MSWEYEVCSNSIWIGNVVVVHWVGCVCNQSWYICTCRSNSWHKLQMAAFAQLAVVGRGSNTFVYVIAIFTMCEITEQRICIKFMWRRAVSLEQCDRWWVLGLWVWPRDKPAIITVEGSHVSATKEGTPGAKQNKGYVTAIFLFEGIVNHEYAPNGQTINKEFYMEVLRHLHESVCQKRLENWQDGDWILHHDSAPPHTSHLVHQFLAKHGTTQLQQLPYSPDLTLCDFFLFPRLKKVLKGHHL